MPYPIITPMFFQELTDPGNSENADVSYLMLTTPYAVEYIFTLENERVVRRLMEQKDILAYRIVSMKPEIEAEYAPKGEKLVKDRPILKHYWGIKTLTMNLLQDRRYSLEQRMLMVNYVYRTIQAMIDKSDEVDKELPAEDKQRRLDGAIAAFGQSILNAKDHNDIIKYFEEVRPNYAYSFQDGLSFLRILRDSEDVTKLRTIVYNKAGVPVDADSFKYETEKHTAIKEAYREMFGWRPEEHNENSEAAANAEFDRSHYMEQILVNYVWSYCFPYADLGLDLWENFMFLNTLYNALKITVGCYLYESKTPDEDFVFAIKTFDKGLQELRERKFPITRLIIDSIKKAGLTNNGDMAILSIS